MNEQSNKPVETEVSAWRATLHALFGRGIPHFPRALGSDGSWTTPDSDALIEKAEATLKDLSPTDSHLDAVIVLARETLDEVKAQTEYQDSKATRLLTIITFLSALAGILFGRLTDHYPFHTVLARIEEPKWHVVLVCSTYAGFAAFVLLAVCGAMVTFHALCTRFRYPNPSQSGLTNSFLFYPGILRMQAGEWANSYLNIDDKTKLASDIKIRYLKNYIVESYLIAAKIADKVRYLNPAQSMLANATKILVLWLLLCMITFAFVPPVEKAVGPIKATAVSTEAPSPQNP